MKTIQFMAVMATFLVLASSCVEKSEKYQSMVAERDSLQLQTMNLEESYNETLNILNDVEEGFAQIRKAEGKMMMDVKRMEGASASKKEQLAIQMNQIKEMLEQNKAKIEELQRQSNQRGKENAKLTQTIQRMQSELDEKVAFIASLQAELEKKNTRISELNTSVTQLSAELSQLTDVTEKQQQKIQNQDVDMNTVWYTLGTSSDLKASNILTSNGLFRAKTVLDKEFDKSIFTKVDRRSLKVIPTESKRVKVLTSHPKESYKLVTADDKTISIEILNVDNFWSVSNYLVIQK